MTNNDVIRNLRYVLDVSDQKMVDICLLADYPLTLADMTAYLKKDDEEGFVACPDAVMAHFLEGLVFFKRGRDDNRPRLPVEKRPSNNSILKKVRVAFELRDDDMHEILQAADLPMTKPELNALFRKPEHKNYRACGDQVLRNFLRGLALRERG